MTDTITGFDIDNQKIQKQIATTLANIWDELHSINNNLGRLADAKEKEVY